MNLLFDSFNSLLNIFGNNSEQIGIQSNASEENKEGNERNTHIGGEYEKFEDKIIGSGQYARVYEGIYEGHRCAIKTQAVLSAAGGKKLENEIKILHELNHPFVVQYYRFNRQKIKGVPEFIDIVLQWCDGTIEDFIQNRSMFPDFSEEVIIKQSLSGVAYLHEKRIIHKDIKPSNILLSNTDKQVKLTDFGISKEISDHTSHVTQTGSCTRCWSCPEILDPSNQQKISKAVDIFSLGCVYYYIIFGTHPFGDLNTVLNIMSEDFYLYILQIDDCYNAADFALKDLLRSMMQYNPENRLDCAGVACHPYFWTNDQKIDYISRFNDMLHTKDGYHGATPNQIDNLIGRNKILEKLNWKTRVEPVIRNKGKKIEDNIWGLIRHMRNLYQHNHQHNFDLGTLLGNTKEDKGKFINFWEAKFPFLFTEVNKIYQKVVSHDLNEIITTLTDDDSGTESDVVFNQSIDFESVVTNPVSELLQYCGKRKIARPSFDETCNDNFWTVFCTSGDQCVQASDHDRKKAKKYAAKKMIEHMSKTDIVCELDIDEDIQAATRFLQRRYSNLGYSLPDQDPIGIYTAIKNNKKGPLKNVKEKPTMTGSKHKPIHMVSISGSVETELAGSPRFVPISVSGEADTKQKAKERAARKLLNKFHSALI